MNKSVVGNGCCNDGGSTGGGYRGFVQPYVLNKLPLQGPRGAQGEDGDMGPMGIQGAQGKNGRPGGKGLVGFQGDLGEDGLAGVVGEVGDVGEDGFSGRFIDEGISTAMIFRVSSDTGQFGNNLFYPNFQLVESRLASLGAPCGNVNTSVWNNSGNVINMGLFNSQLGGSQPAGFLVTLNVKNYYTITYNLSMFINALIPVVFFLEVRNLVTGVAYPGSRSSVSVGTLQKHVSHTFLANVGLGSQIGLFISHEEVGEGDDKICVKILNSKFLILRKHRKIKI